MECQNLSAQCNNHFTKIALQAHKISFCYLFFIFFRTSCRLLWKTCNIYPHYDFNVITEKPEDLFQNMGMLGTLECIVSDIVLTYKISITALFHNTVELILSQKFRKRNMYNMRSSLQSLSICRRNICN